MINIEEILELMKEEKTQEEMAKYFQESTLIVNIYIKELIKRINQEEIKIREQESKYIPKEDRDSIHTAYLTINKWIENDVRIDIWTHFMRGCIMKLCTPI